MALCLFVSTLLRCIFTYMYSLYKLLWMSVSDHVVINGKSNSELLLRVRHTVIMHSKTTAKFYCIYNVLLAFCS